MTPKAKILRPTETDICKSIAFRLRLAKPRCFWTHIANEQPMSWVNRELAGKIGAIQKAMGKERGILDYIFVGLPIGCPVAFYEVKRDKGGITEEQDMFMEVCATTGVIYDVRFSDDWQVHYAAIEKILKNGGVL